MKWTVFNLIVYYLIACLGGFATVAPDWQLSWSDKVIIALSWPVGWYYAIKDYLTNLKVRYASRRKIR